MKRVSARKMSKTDEVRLLFVYGTLRRSYMRLPVPMRQMRPPHVLDEHGKWSGEGVLRGYALWDVGAYPGVVPAPDGAVVGDLVDVSTMAGMLDVLDEYEGIGGVFERPFEYRREVRSPTFFFATYVELCL